jgi:hypothetical protein
METIIIHTEENKMELIKDFLKSIKVTFETKTTSKVEESPYNPEFVAKIRESEEDYKNGKIHRVNLDEIWK